MTCASCEKPLFSAVTFCPYCGARQAPGSAAPAQPRDTAGLPAAELAPETVTPPPPAERPKGEKTRIRARSDQDAGAPATSKTAKTTTTANAAAAAAYTAVAPPADGVGARPAGTTVPKKGLKRWQKILLTLIAVVGLFAYIGQRNSARGLVCQRALSEGQQALERGDLDAARQHSDVAESNCAGPAKDQLSAFQKAVQLASSVEGCSSNQRLLNNQLNEHKLESASKTLARLVPKCAAEASSGKLRRRLTQAQASANSALQQTRRALTSQNLPAARQALAALLAINSEAEQRAELENDIVRLQTLSEARGESVPAAVTAPTAPAPVQHTPAPALLSAPVPAPPATDENRTARPGSVANAKAEMAQTFINDAETALAQRRFDSARTYLDSARRMDPANPRLESLQQQIREKERQLLQQDTSIR
jgi:hypothetical protein